MYWRNLSADVDVEDVFNAFKATSLADACEFDRYGENFCFFFSESFFINFSTLLLSDSSRVSLGSWNDWLPRDVFDSCDFKVEKFSEPRVTGFVFGGNGIGLSPL